MSQYWSSGRDVLAAPAAATAKSTITLSGSTSVAPLVSQLAPGYIKAKPGKAKFKLLQGGSDIGIADVARGRVTLGMSSRDPQPSDPGGLVFNRIARDGICIATNTSNPLGGLSQDQIQAIFSGSVRSWSQVPAPSASGPIDLIVRNAASGTQDAFQNIFMGLNLRVAPSASQKASNGLVQQSIRSNKNAIGYVDFNFTAGLNTIDYKGVSCSLRNAKSGQYGGTRNFWLGQPGQGEGRGRGMVEVDQVGQQSAARDRQELGAAEVAAAIACDRFRLSERQGRRRPHAHRRACPPWSSTGLSSGCSRSLACTVLALIAGMIVFVFVKAWPSFSHNGLAWFGSGGNVDQQLGDIFNSPADPDAYVYHLRAWPLLYATALTTLGAVIAGLVISLLAAVFIVEFAPDRVSRARAGRSAAGGRAVGRLRADRRARSRAVRRQPPHQHGAQGVGDQRRAAHRHEPDRRDRDPDRDDHADHGRDHRRRTALGAAPVAGGRGGAWRQPLARGLDDSVRAVRPAIIAAAVLATARALGEAIMLSMVSGSVGFAPNPLDGLTFFFEPTRPLAATVVDNADGLSVVPFGQTLYAFAAVLLVSAMLLSFAGWAAKQPLKTYGAGI